MLENQIHHKYTPQVKILCETRQDFDKSVLLPINKDKRMGTILVK